MKIKTPWNKIYYLDEGMSEQIKNFIKLKSFKDYGMSCQNESVRWANILHVNFPFDVIEIHHGMHNDEGHTWIEINGLIFDPTAAQFDSYPEMNLSFYDTHEIVEFDDLSELLEEVVFYHGTSSTLWIAEDRKYDYLFLTTSKEHAEYHAKEKAYNGEENGEPLIIEIDASMLDGLWFDYDDDLGNNENHYDNWIECYNKQGTIKVIGNIQSSKFKITNISKKHKKKII